VEGEQLSLVGRDEERRAVEAAAADARRGNSAVLVVRGEAGIGKTALVDDVVDAAAGVQVIRVAGIESETELPYAALHRLLLPLLDHVDALPRPQYEALGSAFGLLPSVTAPDRFLLGLATLTLMSEFADTTPVLCVVDDAQWLDRASLDVLTFVARRLLADRIAMFFCVREEPTRIPSLDGFTELSLRGVDENACLALLARQAVDVDPHVARRIVAAACGNPLAVTEFAAGLTPAQLSGAELAGEYLPLSSRIEAHYLRRIRALGTVAQAVLLLASAEPSGDPELLWHALEHFGVDTTVLPAIEDAVREFATFSPAVAFRHGLIRSAVYRGSPLALRRRAHAALAEATDPVADPDRRAWHLGAAASRPDEDIAAALERSAVRAGARGGHAAESVFLTRASDLTPDVGRRGARLVAAAEAALQASDYRRCQTLLGQSEPLLSDPPTLARAARARGAILSPLGHPGRAPAALAAAAQALVPFDDRLARNTWLEALSAAWLALDHAQGTTLRDVAVAALAAPRPRDEDRTVADLLLEGVATRVAVGYTEAVPILRRAAAMLADIGARESTIVSQPLLVCLGGHELWDLDGERAMLEGLAERERSRGALMGLWLCLFQLSIMERWAGRLSEGQTYGNEADAIRDAIGLGSPWRFPDVERNALHGRDEELREAVASLNEMTETGIFGLAQTSCRLALTVYALSCGRYDEACASARLVYDEDTLVFGNQVLPELVEGASRAGDLALAEAALRRLTVRASASGTEWARGLLARSQALLAGGSQADEHYRNAIDLLGRAGVPLDHARAHLLYGEWLRREKQRTDAVSHLRAAYEMFTSMGTDSFAERARAELHAAGARMSRRVPDGKPVLTPQEEQVARLAGQGLTNREIAATMFISESTVAYHLKKTFRKLGVSSRRELVRHWVSTGSTQRPHATNRS
jgi:DNA-binding CsgD family transcriptional regulator